MFDFLSNKLTLNKGIFNFSPNGQFLATTQNNKLIIKQLKTLDTPLIFQSSHLIEGMRWSPNSELIFIYNFTQNHIQVFSLSLVKWKCIIKDMKMGFKKILWSPDSRHILSLSKYNECITIWSLKDSSISYIYRPKNSQISFSPNGQYLIIIENINDLDYLLIFSTNTWKLIKKIFCKHVHNIEGVVWSPGSRLFAIWSSLLTDNAVGIYSLEDSKWLSYFKPIYSLTNLNGVKKIKWSFSGQFLAVVDHLDNIYILNNISWSPIAEFHLERDLLYNDYLIYKENIVTSNGEFHSIKSNFILIKERPVSISKFFDNNNNIHGIIKRTNTIHNEHDLPKSFLKLTNFLSFSPCNRYLVNISSNMPAVLWIYSLIQLKLHTLIIFEKPIKHISWSPITTILIISTNSNYVVHWSPLLISTVDMPITNIGQLNVKKVNWHPTGDILAFASDIKLILANVINSETDSN